MNKTNNNAHKSHQNSQNNECIDDITHDIATDGRKQYEWSTRYPPEACKMIRNDCVYLVVLLVLSFVLITFNFLKCLTPNSLLSSQNICNFESLLFFSFSGLLGGVIFSIKYFYRVVARGYWSQDRRYWRILSPWVSLSLGFIIGCMVMAGLMTSESPLSTCYTISIGFFSGYFADEAVGKMYHIAIAIFGKK